MAGLEVTPEVMAAYRAAVRSGGDSTEDIRAAAIAAAFEAASLQIAILEDLAYDRGWKAAVKAAIERRAE